MGKRKTAIGDGVGLPASKLATLSKQTGEIFEKLSAFPYYRGQGRRGGRGEKVSNT